MTPQPYEFSPVGRTPDPRRGVLPGGHCAATIGVEREFANGAEGIEGEGEALACRNLGFDLAQGYFFGRPKPL